MLNDFMIEDHIKNALKEDVPFGDVTTQTLVKNDTIIKAKMNVRKDCVICGLEVAKKVFEILSKDAKVELCAKDGDFMKAGETAAIIEGPAKCVLTGERTALNYLQRMSGIATETAKYVKAMNNPKVKLADTRKTTPGFRMFEKYSVKTGGGCPHRFTTSDCAMVKDNHIKYAGSLTKAVEAVKAQLSHAHKIEVECDTVDQVEEAVKAGADIIMFDNMTNDEIKKSLEIVNGRAICEVSGGVTLDTIAGIAALNPDVISTSAIHAGVKTVDIGLDM